LAWIIEYSVDALRALRKIDKQTQKHIVDYMDYRVAIHPNPVELAKSLSGPMKGKFRYRVGDYRLICEIKNQKMVILVIEIGHRSEIYKR
jgi:mRNA interferase RelE/StbE